MGTSINEISDLQVEIHKPWLCLEKFKEVLKKEIARSQHGYVDLELEIFDGVQFDEDIAPSFREEDRVFCLQAGTEGRFEDSETLSAWTRKKGDLPELIEINVPLFLVNKVRIVHKGDRQGIHRERCVKGFYSAEEIAEATGLSIAEIEEQATREQWTYRTR